MFIHALPFDHPSHSIIGRRAGKLKDPFPDYSLPRLLLRLFRLIRTFRRHSTSQGIVTILDDRMETKTYGRDILRFLLQFMEIVDEPPPDTKNKSNVQIPLL